MYGFQRLHPCVESESMRGWPVERLRFHVSVNPSKSSTLKQLDSEIEVSFVPMEYVGEFGGLRLDHTKRLAEVEGGYTCFRDGDVVVAKITPCFENSKGAIASHLVNGLAFGTTELHVLRPGPTVDKGYLFYVSISHPFRHIGASFMYGAGGQKRVPEDFIKDLRHPLPPLPEQRAIAAFLDRKTEQIDSLIAKKERQIELLQEKRAALISHAVTKGLNPDARMKDSGIEWLGEVPEHWAVAPLFVRYQVQLGKMLDSKRITGDSLAPYLRNTDVQWGKVNVTDLPMMDFALPDRKRFRLDKGDLLVCEGGEVGRCAVWEGQLEDCYYQKALHRVRALTGADTTRYLYYAMFAAAEIGAFRAGADLSTIGHLTAEKLRRHRFTFPPLSEQRAIVEYADRWTRQMDLLSDKVSRSLERLHEYRTALISAAVTGKIDVREEVAS